ncbi:hypothetical protein [Stakelama saccharophila]|uniref:Uncharacterized protein n=1 Tax=Stakelama saccharophila TaxID=3075605 RepID=A0ABZ0BBQ0_9SPHN|nr:hypothetical protein [Stakelama sp. W311]WNO54709.1 hypothetical protein RPR59_05530 [Stakelama sp. W311]
MTGKFFAAAAALSVVAAPAMAAPAQSASARSASSVAVSQHVRASSDVKKSSKLASGALIPAVVLGAGILAIPVIDAVKDDNEDLPDSVG